MGYWGKGAKRAYHHTAPVNTLYGLHESLVMLTEEGLENSWARHQRNHLLLREGLSKLGIHYLVDESSRLPQLNSVFIPEGSDEAEVRSTLLNDLQHRNRSWSWRLSRKDMENWSNGSHFKKRKYRAVLISP